MNLLGGTSPQEELDRAFVAAAAVVRTDVLLAETPAPRPGFWRRRRLRRALKALAWVLAHEPAHRSAMWLSGKVHQSLGEWEAALCWFERAYALAPAEADAAREAAQCAMRLGLRDAAVRHAERAATLEPGDSGVLADLARAYLLAGRVPECQSVLRLALARDPRNAQALTLAPLARHFAATGDAPPGTAEDLAAYARGVMARCA